MDVNLTGALAANVSLMSSPKTDYLPLITQVATTLLTIIATLGGVYLAQYLSAQSEARKHAEEEEKARIDDQKKAYQGFLDAFSKGVPPPIPSMFASSEQRFKEVEWFLNFSSGYLRAALKALDFGDITLPEPKSITSDEYGVTLRGQVQSLSDLVEAIMRIRYSPSPTRKENYGLMEGARLVGNEFGLIILTYLATGKEPIFTQKFRRPPSEIFPSMKAKDDTLSSEPK